MRYHYKPLTRMAKSQKLRITTADKDAEQQKLPFTGLSLGMQNDTATLEEKSGSLIQTKLNYTILSSNCTSSHSPQADSKTYAHKDRHTNT